MGYPLPLSPERGREYPVVKITFVEKDAPLAKKILEIIGGGTLVYYNNNKYLDLLFQDLKSLQLIAVVLNGCMRTPKIEALYRLIDWLNARKLDEKLKITKLGLDNSSMGDNPWLAGFISADGYFYCSFDLDSNDIAKIVKTYMSISQKQLYKATSDIENNTNLYFMDKLREFLDVKKVNKITRNKDNYIELAYEVRTTKKVLV